MKNNIAYFLVFMVWVFSLNAQSKKEQIEYLTFQVDSIRAIQLKEQQLATSREAELQDQIIELNHTLKTMQDEMTGSKVEIEHKKDMIESLYAKILSLQDSLKSINKVNNIKFLGSLEMEEPFDYYYNQMNITVNFFNNDSGYWYLRSLSELKITEQAKIVFQMGTRKFCIIVFKVWNPESEIMYRSPGTNVIGVFENINSKWNFLKKYNTYELCPGNIFGNGSELIGFSVSGINKISLVFNGGYTVYSGMEWANNVIFEFDGLEIYSSFKGEALYCDEAGIDYKTNKEGTTNSTWRISFQESNQDYYDLIETKFSHGKEVSTRTLQFNPFTQKYE